MGLGGDEDEGGHAAGVADGVLEGEVRAGGVAEQGHAVEAEVGAQGFDVVHLPVAPVRLGVRGRGGAARAARVELDQPPVRVEAAEVCEVGGVLHRPAGQADERAA
ncbi:hypothetical protein GCM10020001_093990 [Nonomuraea salmonea]